MPFYEYKCGDCDHRLEVLQKISDAPLAYCPECNHASLKKLISAAAFRLKGSGWYETDFKNSGAKKQDSTDSKAKDNKSAEGSGDASKTSDKKTDTPKPVKSSESASSSASSTQS